MAYPCQYFRWTGSVSVSHLPPPLPAQRLLPDPPPQRRVLPIVSPALQAVRRPPHPALRQAQGRPLPPGERERKEPRSRWERGWGEGETAPWAAEQLNLHHTSSEGRGSRYSLPPLRGRVRVGGKMQTETLSLDRSTRSTVKRMPGKACANSFSISTHPLPPEPGRIQARAE